MLLVLRKAKLKRPRQVLMEKPEAGPGGSESA